MNSLKRDLLVARLELGGEVPDEHADDDEHHPEQQALQGRVQPEPPTSLKSQDYHGLRGVRHPKRPRRSRARPPRRSGRASSTTSGTRSRSLARHFPVDEEVLQLLAPPKPRSGRSRSPGRRFRTLSRPGRRRSSETTAASPRPASTGVESRLERRNLGRDSAHNASGIGTSPGTDSGIRETAAGASACGRPARASTPLLVKTTAPPMRSTRCPGKSSRTVAAGA